MSYGRIRRGPMAGDAFTQIRNAVFRDARLSAKAMGIFGNISTHRDGWGITPESISAQMRDGVDAVKSGLRELERLGYLQRERERRPNGTLGASSYFITDQPELIAESPSSEPEVENPPVDEPPVDQPPQGEPAVDQPAVDDQPHKKITNSTRPSGEDHPPSPPPAPTGPVGAEDGEDGEGAAPEQNVLAPAERAAYDALARIATAEPRLALGVRELVRLAPLAAPWLTGGTEAQLQQALTAGLPAVVDSPAGLVRRRLLDKLPPQRVAAAAPALPEWCGCGDHPAARYNPRFRKRDGGLCEVCHPDAVRVRA
ncbi:hypothetical protein ACIOHE_15775 [Streptomyces sp. NPDC087851]|uniref:hypothetical protein n=1 Tax=Streptomyces sp. NPDC087851 TaxID=3365810 RepID=UPI0038195893